MQRTLAFDIGPTPKASARRIDETGGAADGLVVDARQHFREPPSIRILATA